MHRYDNILRWCLMGVLFIVICLIDQLTKYAATHAILTYRSSLCSVTPVLNTGISWSIGSYVGALIPQVVTVLVMAVYLILCVLLYKYKAYHVSLFGMTCIMAGGFSNLIDRLLCNGVIDFIALHYGPYSFAIFNVADIAVVCGTLWFMIHIMRAHKFVSVEGRV